MNPIEPIDLYRLVVKGSYPELYSNPNINIDNFYSSYIQSYIERDVSSLINVKNKLAFRKFMELIASLTGQEIIYDNIAKMIGVDKKTIMCWISILLAGDIIYLLEPYFDFSLTKRIIKRPKIYFTDTGLACYLAKLNNPDFLLKSAFGGRFVETYIINELRKNYFNNVKEPNFYYYRDSNMNEIDLIVVNHGIIHKVGCKSGMTYNSSATKSFKVLSKTMYENGTDLLICLTKTLYKLENGVLVIPVTAI